MTFEEWARDHFVNPDFLTGQIARLAWEQGFKEAMETSYVPQENALECIQMLRDAGFGRPGTPNTLWAMVKQATEQIRTQAILNKPEFRDKELTELFHKIWTSQVGTEGYNKKDWQALVNKLRGIGVIV